MEDVARGASCNIGDLLARHLIKPLHRCRICLTGFDPEEIEDIRIEVEALGGAVHPDLTDECSHLIVHEQCQPSGNVKAKYARTWNIPILKQAWLTMCLQEHFLVETTGFVIDTLEDEVELEGEQTTASPDTRITKDFFKDCTVFCPKDLMDVITSTGAKRHDVVDEQLTHYVVHDRVLSREHQDVLQTLVNVKVVHDDWISECVRAGERLDEEPFLLNLPSNTTPSVTKPPSTETSGKKLFGLKSSGSRAPLPLKGYVFNGTSSNAQIVVRLGASLSNKGLRITDKMTTTRTDEDLLTTLWLEAVERAGKFLEFGDKWYYRPLHVMRSTNLSKHVICLTGFDAVEREAVKLLIETCKGECTDSFTKRNTLIIAVAKSSGPKIAKAHEICLQVVKLQWLLDSVSQGEVLPFRDYSLIPNGGITKDISSPIQLETPMKEQLVRKLVVPSPLVRDRDSLIETQSNATIDASTILKGCVIAISHRLWHRRQQLHDAVVELGALFVWTYDSSCTHYIHAGVLPQESFQEFRVVSKAGKHIVHPAWIEKCREVRGRVSEGEYPHTYNNEPIKRDFEEKIGNFPLQVKRFSPPPQLDRVTNAHGPGTFNQLTYKPVQATSPPSPDLAATLPPQSSPTTHPLTDGRLFVLSGVTSSVRSALKYRISKLGASLSRTADLWDPLATHLLCNKPSGSEKFFAAMASGTPILKCAYIEESYKERRFLGEEGFEIGEADAETETEKKLVRAMRGWRERVISTTKKAFDGWRVIVLMDDASKATSVERVLVAGGAERVEAFPTHILYTGSDNKDKAELIKGTTTLVKTSDYFSEYLLKGPSQ